MTSTLATLQNLRTFTFNNHPTELEEGQLAFNLAAENQNLSEGNANIYMYVGNGSDLRMDEDGTVLVPGNAVKKGWIRYSLRNMRLEGDNIYGDLSIINSKLRITSSGSGTAELLIPTEVDTPDFGTGGGSLRWNSAFSILQAWNGSKWDTTSKVSVGTIAPANPSNGDMWLDPTGPSAFYVYVVPSTGPAYWAEPTSGPGGPGLQPGNGVTANAFDEIDTIDPGAF